MASEYDSVSSDYGYYAIIEDFARLNIDSGIYKIPVRNGYTFIGWNTKQDGSGTYVYDDSDLVNKLNKSTSLYAQWTENATLVCNPGQYLAKQSTSCSICPAGSICPGGTYSYSMTSDQGITKCAIGSYSEEGSTFCTACNDGTTTMGVGQASCNKTCPNSKGVTQWNNNSVWNNNNTVSNSCSISSCENVQSELYHLYNNECTVTGTIYSRSSRYSAIDVNHNISNLTYKNNYYFTYNDLLEKDKITEFMYIKTEVENNMVKKRSLCFSILDKMRIPNSNNGTYCLESSTDPLVYENNVAVLKSAFGENNPNCIATDTRYTCEKQATYFYYNNYFYTFAVGKDGYVHVDYDTPPSQGNAYPYCRIQSATGYAYCGSFGCLDGETEVEVYDRKKKKRRRKKLKDVTPDDLILCWDFNTGKLVFIEPLWIKRVETMSCYYLLEFSDGSFLKIIGDHKVFDVDRGKFVNAGCDNELKIGSHVFNSNGEIVELVSWKKVEEEIEAYNVITNYHMNLFANGILTSCVFSNIYSIEDMKYVLDEDVERLTDEDLEGIDNTFINGLRLNEVPCSFRGSKESTLTYIRNYIKMLISKEK